MKKREPVSHIMTKNVKTLNETNSLEDVLELIKNDHIRHIPITRGKKVEGIISSSDIKRLFLEGIYENQENANKAIIDMFTIGDIMHKNPVSISDDTTIKEVAEMFINSPFHAVPVIDNDENLVGIVSVIDVLKYMLEQY
jgi:CBS domain-containing protein